MTWGRSSPAFVVAVALALQVSPSFSEEVTECDVVETEVIEALSFDGENNVIYVPEEDVLRATTVVETFTGERYGKVDQVVIAEMGDHDVAVIFDIGGCVTQVDMPPDLL